MKPEIRPSRTKLIPISSAPSVKITDTKLIVRDRSNIYFISKDQIKYCVSDSNYSTIHLQSGKKIMSSKCLKHIASNLHAPKFKRIHSKYLININFLEKIEITNKKACMQGGDVLPISRARFKDIITSLTQINNHSKIKI